MEIWKQVEGYEGRYEVSSYGRVKSFAQDSKNGKIKYGHLTHRGYRHILLYDGKGGKKWHLIHRLVAQAFIPNPDNLPQVNHIDGNKHNHRLENLQILCPNCHSLTSTFRARNIKKIEH